MAKIKRTNLSKSDMKNLPSVNGDEFKEACAYYTELVFTKTNKIEAFKKSFPDKYKDCVDKSNGNSNIATALIKRSIYSLERTQFMQECFYQGNKHWWMKFLGKKQRVFEKLYEDAVSDDVDIRDRHNASKIFLSYVPDAPKEDKLTVEVKVGSDEFKSMLQEKKRMLYSAANEDILDAEVDND